MGSGTEGKASKTRRRWSRATLLAGLVAAGIALPASPARGAEPGKAESAQAHPDKVSPFARFARAQAASERASSGTLRAHPGRALGSNGRYGSGARRMRTPR
jgi:hypothetical protein